MKIQINHLYLSCGIYKAKETPLSIPNREVKLCIANGTVIIMGEQVNTLHEWDIWQKKTFLTINILIKYDTLYVLD